VLAAAVVSGLAAAPALAAPNQQPQLTIPASELVDEQGSVTYSSANGNEVGINDPDSDPDQIKVVMDADDGLLKLADTSGLDFEVGDGEDDSTTTFRGTNAEIAAALDGMTFTATGDEPDGFGGIAIAVDDEGHMGEGG
jgi:hypothetical protein